MINTDDNLKRMLELVHDQASRIIDRIDDAAPPSGLAAQLYCERRRRAAWFEESLFWEPAWDLLLYLYDADESGRDDVSVDRALQACAAVTEASAMRWINLLINHDYVTAADPYDGAASVDLRLSAKGRRVMTGYLRESRRLSQLP